MTEVTALSGTLGALKSATDLLKTFINLRDTAMVQAKVIELHAQILSAQEGTLEAQSDQFTLLERVRELEKEVADLKAWETEKQKYELVELTPGVVAYALKEETEGTGRSHYLCANCYTDGHKSFLQQETRHPGRTEVRVCHKCGAELYIHGTRTSEFRPAPRPTYGRR